MQKALTKKMKEWRELADWLKNARQREMQLRKELIAELFGEEANTEGTHKLKVPGLIVKATVKVSRTIDEAALPAVAARLPEGTGDRLVNWKPSLSIREYKKLPEDVRHIFDEALVVKPGAPTLTIESAKGN